MILSLLSTYSSIQQNCTPFRYGVSFNESHVLSVAIAPTSIACCLMKIFLVIFIVIVEFSFLFCRHIQFLVDLYLTSLSSHVSA